MGPDRRKATAWPAGPSVQVSVAPAGLGGALSTVTIQAQQCLEGVWSLSRVNSFLPPTCLVSALRRWATGSQLTSFWAPDHIWVLCGMGLAMQTQEGQGCFWLACLSGHLMPGMTSSGLGFRETSSLEALPWQAVLRGVDWVTQTCPVDG